MADKYFGLIMAGGQGTRFWPYSTEKKPKQFLNIIGKKPLIHQTFFRLKKFIKKENIYVVADKKYLNLVKESIPGFSEANFIAEPSPKNTAPCLILANIVLSRKNPDANLLVVPADHYIPDLDTYATQMKNALEFAENKCILTAGIKPNLAHTGYGYINFEKDSFINKGNTRFFEVNAFKEKPKIADARRYLKAGNYYWNSGMFVYKLRFFKAFLETYAPYYFNHYLKLEKSYQQKATLKKIFDGIIPKSIDYALMEKVKEVRMFEAGFLWSDVGAWLSVYELNKKDKNQNVDNKSNILINTRNTLLFSTDDKPIGIIGLDHIAVINTENGILVANMDELQQVNQVLEKLKKK
jgi:mannose-1-phosphate guanylyltransferase